MSSLSYCIFFGIASDFWDFLDFIRIFGISFGFLGFSGYFLGFSGFPWDI